METRRAFGVAVAMLSAAMCVAEKPAAVLQQDAAQQEKHAAEMTMLVRSDTESGEGQEARQKITLELVAADAQTVKGKPYSADTSTETVQTLSDGNRIVRRTESKFFRDSDGRTRREETFGNIDPEHPTPHEVKVFVDDPMTGTAFVLDPGSKSADKMHRMRKILDERNAEDDGTRVMFKSVNEKEAGEQNAPGRMMVKFRDEHSGNPGDMLIRTSDEKRDVVNEDLGGRNIEGVECTGSKKTITIPAGAVGNEKPISIVTETWFAPAIAAVVESTTDDPRYGKTTYRLTNVQLNEPSRSLFEPPADYKVSSRR